MTAHPAEQLLAAARDLVGYDPTGPADLAYTLRTLNTAPGSDNVLYRLGGALDAWADLADGEAWTNGDLIADMLRAAAENLQAVGEFLDRAREATGHWDAEGSER